MRSLERAIEKGIHAGGGISFIFGVPGICDGIAMGHEGMNYSLASRDLIADIIECVVNAHCLDGLVMLTNCDKITPGMLMGVARLDVPGIVVTAGPMISGRFGKQKLSLVKDTFEAVGRRRKGRSLTSNCPALRWRHVQVLVHVRDFTLRIPWRVCLKH